MSLLSTVQADVSGKQEAPFAGGSSGLSAAGVSTSKISNLRAPDFPDFRQTGAYADSTRRAGRLNASTVSPAEVQSLLTERQDLLDKKFSGTLTRLEEIRLEYVRWSLDRIEDAQHGADLDQLESHIARYEDFREKLESFKEALTEARMRRHR